MMSGEGSFDEWYGISEEDESTEIVEMPPESAANGTYTCVPQVVYVHQTLAIF